MNIYKVSRRLAAVVAVVSAAAMAVSCNDADKGLSSPGDNNVVMSLGGMTRAATDNTQVYVFEGAGADRGDFHHRVLQINRTTDGNGTGLLTMSMPEGTWDLALVGTADGAGAPSFLLPTAGQPRANQKMFELTPSGGVLPQAPELVMARVDGKQINPNALNEAETSFIRNVGMVRLTIKEPGGLNTTAVQKVSISKVPTTLDWNGHLMPNKNSPTVSTAWMQGTFTITESGGVQSCSTVDFLVPAHRGDDVTANEPTDFSPNLLDVKVELTMTGGGTYTSTKQIPVAPLAGKILQVNLIIGGELNVESDIIQWEERYTEDVDIKGNPLSELRVSKTRLDMLPLIDNLTATAKSGGVNYPLEVEVGEGGDWLAWAWGSGATANNLGVLGDPETYDGVARTSYIDLVVNNFKKRIPATQQHTGTGSGITAPAEVILTPNNPTRSVPITTTGGAQWKISTGFLPLTNLVSNPTPSTGNSGANITFTRLAPNANTPPATAAAMCENDTLRVRNITTLETKHIIVKNLYMRSDDIRVSSVREDGRQDTTVYVNPIEVYGGSGNFTVVSKPSWVLEGPTLVEYEGDPKFMIKVARQPNAEIRQGTIVFAHNDDPSYTISVNIRQAFSTNIPPFDFFVLRFSWPSGDVDFIVRFADNFMVDANGNTILPETHIPFDNISVGYSQRLFFNDAGVYSPRSASISGPPSPAYTQAELESNLMFWGGDARSGQGETVFFNAPKITPDFEESDIDDSGLPRLLNIDVFGTYSSQRPLYLEIFTYDGGVMRMPSSDYGAGGLRNTNFYNVDSYSSPMTSFADVNDPVFKLTARFDTFSTSSSRVLCRIIYDRWANEIRDIIWSSTKNSNGTWTYYDQGLSIDDGGGYYPYIPPTTRRIAPPLMIEEVTQETFAPKE